MTLAYAIEAPPADIPEERGASTARAQSAPSAEVFLRGVAAPLEALPREPEEEFTVPQGAGRARLFAAFQPLVKRLIRQYGEDPELRQDLLGEIYCRFCALLDAYDPDRGVPLRPYLVRTLTASVYTYTRSQWRRQQRERTLDSDEGLGDAALSVDPEPQWSRDMMLQEILNGLPHAISQLPLRQRQVVIWRYYESRSFEEIAELLRVRPTTARSLLRHGLNNLRRRVASQEVPWD